MAVDAGDVSICIPGIPGAGGVPQGDVAGLLDTFEGYNMVLGTKKPDNTYTVKSLTPWMSSDRAKQNVIYYKPGLGIVEHVNFMRSKMGVAGSIPEHILSPYSAMLFQPNLSPLEPWRVRSMVVRIRDEDARYFYSWDYELSFKFEIKRHFKFPLLASWGMPAEVNSQAEEVDSMAQVEELFQRVFAQDEHSSIPLYLQEFAPLEPGQLRLWISTLSGAVTCLVENHPEDPYEGSMEGLEGFLGEIMGAMQQNNRRGYGENENVLCLDVGRSNGYNATDRARKPGSWVITNMCSPNVATSSQGVVTPHHFGLPDLTTGEPIPAPAFQLP